MTDLEIRFRTAVDTLDTGVPDQPDLAAVRVGERRLRRRRAALLSAAAAATVAAVVAVPMAVTDGGDRAVTPPVASDPVEPQPSSVEEPDADDMSTGVLDHLPDAVPRGSPDVVREYVVAETGETPSWTLIFDWEQAYDVPDLVGLEVTARRLPPGQPAVDLCATFNTLGGDCTSESAPGGVVSTMDAAHLPDDPADHWTRILTFRHVDLQTDVTTLVSVRATAAGDSWEDAEARLPTRDTLVGLIADERFHPPVRTGEDPPGDG